MTDPLDLVSVYKAADVTEAFLVKNMLLDQQVDAFVAGQTAIVANLNPVEVYVRQHDESRARPVIAEYQANLIQRAERPEWRCAKCDTSNPGAYDECDECGAPRPSADGIAADSPLYDRLGGVYSIAAVVDDFIDRIMDDPRINANPKVNEAHHRVTRAGFKYLVTEMLCGAAGGPQVYSGRGMYDSHAHLEITEQEWQFFLEDLRQSLAKFKVPQAEGDEILALIESTKMDIVIGR